MYRVYDSGAPRRKKRRSGCGCLFTLLFIVILIMIIVFVVLIYFVVSYENWLSSKETYVNNLVQNDVNSGDLERKMEYYNNSEIQRETLDLTCEELEYLVQDAIEEDVGLVCHGRGIDVYVKYGNYWYDIKLWQGVEGRLDFTAYNVLLGPISLSDWSWGLINDEINGGFDEANDLVMESQLTRRKVEEFWVDEDGVRIVGVLEDGS